MELAIIWVVDVSQVIGYLLYTFATSSMLQQNKHMHYM